MPSSAAAMAVISECLTEHNQLEHSPIAQQELTVHNAEFVPVPRCLEMTIRCCVLVDICSAASW